MGLSYICSTELVIEKGDENPEMPTSRGFPSNRLRQDGRVLTQGLLALPVPAATATDSHIESPSTDVLQFSETGQ